LANSSRVSNLNSLAAAVAEIKGNPKFCEVPLAQGHTHVFFWWDLMMGLGKLQLHAKVVVAGCIYYKKILGTLF